MESTNTGVPTGWNSGGGANWKPKPGVGQNSGQEAAGQPANQGGGQGAGQAANQSARWSEASGFYTASQETSAQDGLGALVGQAIAQIKQLASAQIALFKLQLKRLGRKAKASALSFVAALVLLALLPWWFFHTVELLFELIVPGWAASLITFAIVLALIGLFIWLGIKMARKAANEAQKMGDQYREDYQRDSLKDDLADLTDDLDGLLDDRKAEKK